MSTWRTRKPSDVSYSGYLPARIAEKMNKARAITEESLCAFRERAIEELADRIIKKHSKKK